MKLFVVVILKYVVVVVYLKSVHVGINLFGHVLGGGIGTLSWVILYLRTTARTQIVLVIVTIICSYTSRAIFLACLDRQGSI